MDRLVFSMVTVEKGFKLRVVNLVRCALHERSVAGVETVRTSPGVPQFASCNLVDYEPQRTWQAIFVNDRKWKRYAGAVE